MDTPTVRPKKKGGRRSQGMVEQLHIQCTPELKDWVMAQPGDAAAFIRAVLEAEKRRREREAPPAS